jgi:hypothetical protein
VESEAESGDWLMRTWISGFDVNVGGLASERGVLNAPVLAFCSFSNSSWSPLGRRGGAGPGLKDVA